MKCENREVNDLMERLKVLNDFVFKKTFGEEETKDNLIALLNAILSKKDRDKLVTLEIVENKELTPDKFHTTFHLWEDEVKDYKLTDVVEIHFIEMEKFRKLQNKNLKEDSLQRWLSFFREDISEIELRELMDMDVDIKKAEEKIEYLSSDPQTLALYKARERSLHDRANMINGAKEEGIIEGIEKGKAEGATEKALRVAEKMLKRGDVIEDIIDLTELPIEKILELKKKMMH